MARPSRVQGCFDQARTKGLRYECIHFVTRCTALVSRAQTSTPLSLLRCAPISCYSGDGRVSSVSPCMSAISALRASFTMRCCATKPLPRKSGDSTSILNMLPQPPEISCTTAFDASTFDLLEDARDDKQLDLHQTSIFLHERKCSHFVAILRESTPRLAVDPRGRSSQKTHGTAVSA